MRLDTEEIRHRAEAFEPLRRREWHRVRAGHTSHPAFTRLYDDNPFLDEPELLSEVERSLAAADPETEEDLRCLRAWVAERRIGRATAPLRDEYFAWEATTTAEVGDRELPLRRLRAVIGAEKERDARRRMMHLRDAILEEAATLWLELVEREREAVRELGYGDALEARDRLAGRDHEAALAAGRRAARATAESFSRLRERVLGPAGLPMKGAVQSDEWRLRQLPLAGGALTPVTLRRLLPRDFRAAGLSPDAFGRLSLDLEERPLKRPGSFCAPIRVPEHVVGVVGAVGGWDDLAGLLSVTGEGLDRAFVRPDLPFERRYLGDPARGAAHAFLFRSLLANDAWLRHVPDLEAADRDGVRRRAAWLELLTHRRDVARLRFQVELWKAGGPADARGAYREWVTEATGFRPARQGFVEALADGFEPAVRLRGRMQGARLARTLTAELGEDWFRSPAAGPVLCERFARGRVRERAHSSEAADAGEMVAPGDGLAGEPRPSRSEDALVAWFREGLA